MKNANITAWVNDLATTDAEQAQGALCYTDPEGRKAYCCLGKGSTLVPGLQIFEPERGDSEYDTSVVKVKFGDAQEDDLAPREFMEWLGYEEGVKSECAFNVFVDFPDYLTSPNDTKLRYFGAADLNDAGFTFAQIADVIRYFGLHDKVRP